MNEVHERGAFMLESKQRSSMTKRARSQCLPVRKTRTSNIAKLPEGTDRMPQRKTLISPLVHRLMCMHKRVHEYGSLSFCEYTSART